MGSGGVCAVDDVVEFLSWGLSVQDDAGSAVEAVLDGLDLGVGNIGDGGDGCGAEGDCRWAFKCLIGAFALSAGARMQAIGSLRHLVSGRGSGSCPGP